ncbi:MAG: hypothetical protein FJY67_06470 [Calditrichaeota bacterium]|nr:hypothetical protein [Calditrichota bacterium]
MNRTPRRSALCILLTAMLMLPGAYAQEHRIESDHLQPQSVRIATRDHRSANLSLPDTSLSSALFQTTETITPKFDAPRRDPYAGRLRWSSAHQNAITSNVAISGDGNWVAIGKTLNDQGLEVRRGTTGELIYQYPTTWGGANVAIDVSGFYVVFGAMDSAFVFRGGELIRRISLGGYAAGPVAIFGHQFYVTGEDPERRANRLWKFEVGIEQPLWMVEVPHEEAFGWYGLTLANTVVAANGKNHLYVFDFRTGERIWDEPTFNTESPVVLSGDGSILATASLTGRLRVFARDPDTGYRLMWHYAFSGAQFSWVTCCALSLDGRHLAAGTLDFYEDRYSGRVALFETYGVGRPLWISDDFGDEVSDVKLSGNGRIIAATSWGDLDHQRPDLKIFDRSVSDPEPIYQLTTDGSLEGLSIGAGGEGGLRVVAGGKGTHNRVFGRGGQVHSIDLNFAGAVITGFVRDSDGSPLPDANVRVYRVPFHTLSTLEGRYRLTVDVGEAMQVALEATKPGFRHGRREVWLEVGRELSGVNFVLEPAGPPPENLRASQGVRNKVILQWVAYNRAPGGEGNGSPVRSAVGSLPPRLTPDLWGDRISPPQRDNPDEADSIIVYRSHISGGPYVRIAALPGGAERFEDRLAVYPQRRYYYAITALFRDGESLWSNEAEGWLDDDFIERDAELRPIRRPNLDGRIDEGEWEGAVVRDVSDVFGYDGVDTAGSAVAYLAFDDDTDELLVGMKYLALRQLEERCGIGIYVDDDGNGRWSAERPGSEGNFWGYWRDGAPDMRYRSLSLGDYRADPYYRYENPPLAFGDGRGHVEIEMAIPLGFFTPQEVALYAPDYTIGLGLFAVHRDQQGNPVFDGWWPQDMVSIVTNPEQFARIRIPARLLVPPLAPEGVSLQRAGSFLRLRWDTPTAGLDGGALRQLDGIAVMRNGEVIGRFPAESRTLTDSTVMPLGHYEYEVAGFVRRNGVPEARAWSVPVEDYAVQSPEVTTYAFDDGQPEQMFVVDFQGDLNRFAVRFEVDIDRDSAACWWFDFYTGAATSVKFFLASDEGGWPSERPLGPVIIARPRTANEMVRVHYPGIDQAVFLTPGGRPTSVWGVLEYLPESPGSPPIGVDHSAPDRSRNLYYTRAAGWTEFPNGQVMIRAAVGPAAYGEAPGERPVLPDRFAVRAAFPNPFNNRTTLPVDLPVASPITIEFYDPAGREVFRRQFDSLPPGRHHLTLEPDRLDAGLFIVRITTRFGERRQRLVLLK